MALPLPRCLKSRLTKILSSKKSQSTTYVPVTVVPLAETTPLLTLVIDPSACDGAPTKALKLRVKMKTIIEMTLVFNCKTCLVVRASANKEGALDT
jgi:hypothetical protein